MLYPCMRCVIIKGLLKNLAGRLAKFARHGGRTEKADNFLSGFLLRPAFQRDFTWNPTYPKPSIGGFSTPEKSVSRRWQK